MSALASTSIDAEAKNAPTSGRLFFLDLGAGRILSANPDGSDLKTIINEGPCPMPWCSMSPLGPSTGPIWVIPRGMRAFDAASRVSTQRQD
jgi:hypothetical protein